jgi:hypothetical protein
MWRAARAPRAARRPARSSSPVAGGPPRHPLRPSAIGRPLGAATAIAPSTSAAVTRFLPCFLVYFLPCPTLARNGASVRRNAGMPPAPPALRPDRSYAIMVIAATIAVSGGGLGGGVVRVGARWPDRGRGVPRGWGYSAGEGPWEETSRDWSAVRSVGGMTCEALGSEYGGRWEEQRSLR